MKHVKSVFLAMVLI
ncbi:hypothetical protein H1E45_004236, partial [Salmonella enterica]|nr:hypothetical protein [Salmonella enterica]ECE7430942.1 hypothetical protein [Salmonella enterica subsp. enterica serovar Typhimurium]EDD0984602.1 hypothetical protein [Salmonella enterica subsp. enterica serovar Newport]EHB0650325.1 hypothetical protein [Salmonella enterica subsp. enterica serovar Heidelberg]EIM4220372.1 hypothetical protein [Salmonella enterica subsp. enterica serovar Enteritidis]